MVGAGAGQVVLVFVLVAWSWGVSGCPGGLGLCLFLVFVVADAGVVFDLEASGCRVRMAGSRPSVLIRSWVAVSWLVRLRRLVSAAASRWPGRSA